MCTSKLMSNFYKFNITALVGLGFILPGCGIFGGGGASASAAHSSSLVTGSYDHIHIPAYSEYEILGPVFATTEEYTNIDRPYLTYLELLKQAANKGEHDIINVSIEEIKNCVKLSMDEGPYKKDEKACKTKRFGYALAIKYTKPLMDGPYVTGMIQAMQTKSDSSESTETKSSSILPF